jgi:hypothetical protein
MAARRRGRDIAGETAETIEAVLPRNLRDADPVRGSASQSAIHLLHSAEATVAARAHAQMLLAAHAQRPLRHAERRADVRNGQEWLGSQQVLEPRENVSMMSPGCRFLLGPFRQTFDQYMEQLLLQPIRCLTIGDRSCAGFGQTDRSPVEIAQLSCRRTRRSPTRRRGNNEPGPTQYAAVVSELLSRDLNGTPVTSPDGSCVQPLSRPVSDDFARFESPLRHRSAMALRRSETRP